MKPPQLFTYTKTIYCTTILTFLNMKIRHYIGKYAKNVKYEKATTPWRVYIYKCIYIDLWTIQYRYLFAHNSLSNFGGLAPGLRTGSELNRFPVSGKGVRVVIKSDVVRTHFPGAPSSPGSPCSPVGPLPPGRPRSPCFNERWYKSVKGHDEVDSKGTNLTIRGNGNV